MTRRRWSNAAEYDVLPSTSTVGIDSTRARSTSGRTVRAPSEKVTTPKRMTSATAGSWPTLVRIWGSSALTCAIGSPLIDWETSRQR